MLSTGRSSSSSRYPFTPTQWQELEHQALIYKYMASGIPIPSDLLLPIRRSFFLNPTTALPPYYPQPAMGWSCFQMGYGRKAEDPEPGRCRRTDGKKWRCSKEAYPDSKYCERHMHRGKNRSRKPVEISLNTAAAASSTASAVAAAAAAAATCSSSSAVASHPLSISAHDASYYPYQLHYSHHYNTSDNRFCHGMKDADEYGFVADAASAGGRGSSWELKMGSSEYYKAAEEEKKHCFVLGADFKLGKSEKEREEESLQRPLRHFFDEWPQKSRDSWVGLEGESSKTQLSISIPMGLHDFRQWLALRDTNKMIGVYLLYLNNTITYLLFYYFIFFILLQMMKVGSIGL